MAARVRDVRIVALRTMLDALDTDDEDRPEAILDRLAAPLSGILEYAATGLIFAFGIALTTAGNAALIGAAEPAVIVVLAILLLGETAGRSVVVLLTLVTLGLALLIGPDVARTGTPNAGDMLVLGSVVTGALYAILSRRLVLSIEPTRLAFVQQAAGLVVLAPVPAMTLAFTGGFGTLTLTAFALAVLGGLLQNTAAVWLHLEALKWMPAASFALYLGLVPVFALGAARVVLGEPITAPQLVGGALVVAAALIAAKREIALRDVKEMESHT